MSQPQLPLSLQLDDSASFDNFLLTDDTRLLVNELAAQSGRDGLQWLFIHGGESTGKSHLLQAAVRAASDAALNAIYLPLSQLAGESGEDVLAGLDASDLICLDEFDVVAGSSSWERALFNCYNNLLASGGRLLIAAACPPAKLDIKLPDLASRLEGFATFHLKELSHDQRKQALRLRAECRGLMISDDVIDYIFNRGKRDLVSVFGSLEFIDRQALSAQRRLTIPFVRSVMGW